MSGSVGDFDGPPPVWTLAVSLAASSQGIMGTRRLKNDWDGGVSVISPAASPIKLRLEN